MRNIICELPDGHIEVFIYALHPCDNKPYVVDAKVYGPNGYVGRPFKLRFPKKERYEVG